MAWVWIGERPAGASFGAMGLAVVGVGLMVQDGVALDRNAGNAFALLSAVTFALTLTLARRSGKADVLGGTFLGGVFCVGIGLAAAQTIGVGMAVSVSDLTLILFMGGFTIGIGIAFVTWGTSYVPAAEVSLLVLLESVLGPIWVWLFVRESMTLAEIVGGGMVLLAVAFQALTARSRQTARAGV